MLLMFHCLLMFDVFFFKNVVNISLDCGEIDRFMRKEMSKTGNMDYQHERSEMFDLSEGKDESTYTISYFPSW